MDSDNEVEIFEEEADLSSSENESGGVLEMRPVWTVVPDADNFQFPQDLHEFNQRMGIRIPLPKTSKPIEYFNVLSTSLFEILAYETNRYASQVINTEEAPPFARERNWKDVTVDEMSAFIGLYLAMGMVKKPTIESYWSQGDRLWLYETPSFSKVMIRDRFELILQFLHANDNAKCIPRGQPGHDPAHKVRPILDLLNVNFKTAYNPGRDLTVDESMVGFKGRNYTVQYMPGKKAHRWGAKLWILAEADTGYTLHIDLYAGKRNTTQTRSEHGLGFDVVAKLSEHYLGRYHHITVDNGFTSPALAKYMFENDTYMTGTVRETRKGMPKSFRQKIKKGEKLVRQSGPVMALKYGDRKNVCLLSTMITPIMENHENSRGIVSDIPRTVYMYNKLMGGVDIADQQIQTYDPDVKSLKLWKKILINLILRIVVNSYILYVQNMGHRKKMTRQSFTMALYEQLIGDYCYERKRSGRPRVSKVPVPSRFTERHFIYFIPDGKRKICRVCDSKVRTWCPGTLCEVGLCVGDCFEKFHTKMVNEP